MVGQSLHDHPPPARLRCTTSLAAALAWCSAFWLRFNLDIPAEYAEVMLARLPWVLGVHAAIFWALGLYRGLWRYASLPDLQRILIAVGIAALAVPALLACCGLPSLCRAPSTSSRRCSWCS